MQAALRWFPGRSLAEQTLYTKDVRTLLLGGVTKPVTLKADGKPEGGMLHITGSYDLDMTEYGLKPPTLMFGRIKVGRTVKVNYDLLLKS